MRLTPVLATAAAALTVALTATACSAADGGPGPTAAQSSASEQSESPSSTPTDTGEPFDAEEFTSRLEASVEANPTVSIDVQVKLDEQTSATATGVQDLSRNALDMDVDLGGQQLGYLLVDDQYYLEQPPKWVPVSEDSDNPLIQQTLQQIQILSMRNQLDAFVAGLEGAGTKGEEQVEGVTTTHYTATVNTDKAFAELEMDKGEGTPDEVIYDVWLDEDDLIRKMSFTQNGAEATMTATDWGQPVTIEAPAESELAEAPDSGTP